MKLMLKLIHNNITLSLDSVQIKKCIFIYLYRGRGGTVVKMLCYKSERRWFDPSWCQWIFH